MNLTTGSPRCDHSNGTRPGCHPKCGQCRTIHTPGRTCELRAKCLTASVCFHPPSMLCRQGCRLLWLYRSTKEGLRGDLWLVYAALHRILARPMCLWPARMPAIGRTVAPLCSCNRAYISLPQMHRLTWFDPSFCSPAQSPLFFVPPCWPAREPILSLLCALHQRQLPVR